VADSASAVSGTARPTALVFLSLAIGQLLNLTALSALSAHLGLADFGRFGICMLDFGFFAAAANFALAAPSMPMLIQGRFHDRLFATAMGARLWTAGIAMIAYLAFEAAFREREMLWAAVVLAPALILNPSQWEWWFAARQSWRQLLVHRVLGGAVTAGAVLWAMHAPWIRSSLDPLHPQSSLHAGLICAAAAYSSGFVSAALYLISGIYRGRSPTGVSTARSRLPRPWPIDARMRRLWAKSLPISLTTICEFLFVPIGFYAFKAFAGTGPLLGAYGSAYRIILAASMLASSLYVVLLPRFSEPGSQDHSEGLRRVFDRMALAMVPILLSVPFLARPLLLLFFPGTAWDPESLRFAALALSAMGLATYLHLLRMPPLTHALSQGQSWLYCRRFFVAGGANVAMVGAGVLAGSLRYLPMWALAADLVFTGWWLAGLHPAGGAARWGRLAALAAWAAGYLAWAGFWV
jgi:hypothetical protein